MDILKHIAVIITVLFLLLGIPTLMYVDISALLHGTVDAVSSATAKLPEQPSGEFIVLLNKEKYYDTIEQWNMFFSGEDAGVIMSDISCMTVDGDAAGIQLAERFQARLPENQMQLRKESSILVSSRAENNLFDVIIMSREMADVCKLKTEYDNDSILIITVKGNDT